MGGGLADAETNSIFQLLLKHSQIFSVAVHSIPEVNVECSKVFAFVCPKHADCRVSLDGS